MKTSPTQRSLKFLRNAGFTVAVVEKWNPHAMIRQDVFGIGDLLICLPNWGVALVQVTSAANISAREAKALAEPRLRTWLESGGRFLLHGWSKKGARGKRKVWEISVREIKQGGAPSRSAPGGYEPHVQGPTGMQAVQSL